MSARLFEKKDHAKLYLDFRPAPPASIMEYIIAFLQEKYKGKLACAVDLGCGSGQSTHPLADLNKFEKVIGTDISAAQIEVATETFSQQKSMQFIVSPSESMPVGDNSTQLIISCAAAHWFDLPKVYEEGKRVLCENGVMAFMCYQFPTYDWNCPQEDLLDKAIKETFESLDNYWASGFTLANDNYERLTIPYRDFTRAEGFSVERQVGIQNIIGLFKSLSAFQTLCDVKGKDEGERIIKVLHDTLYENIGDRMVTQRFPYYVVLARK